MKANSGPSLEAIRANQDKLDGCKRHRFAIGNPPYEFGMKLTCYNCGGRMDAVKAFVYVQGYEAAGGNANDVIPNFR